ncbi:hypothetical protein AA0488_0544 [Kozakia baliensis NRIC 0488]|nr:hypothetical protein AA0488_0544 [Kozakia baliensis NRIC 0488]GEL63883.1 hypothetical protein KBA01_11690 [Kozakia baliensis]
MEENQTQFVGSVSHTHAERLLLPLRTFDSDYADMGAQDAPGSYAFPRFGQGAARASVDEIFGKSKQKINDARTASNFTQEASVTWAYSRQSA